MGGADIANVINEAGQELYHQPDATAEHSWDLCQEVMLKIQFGPIREFPEAIERLAAERVSAKALVGLALSHVPDLVLVSKQCRGDSYGTILLSSRRRDYPQDSQELFELIVFEVAGRVAEEMTYGNVTSAPWSDMEEATRLAFKLVCEFGWVEELSRPVKAADWRNDPQAGEITFGVTAVLADASAKAKAILAFYQKRELKELIEMVMRTPGSIGRDDITFRDRIKEPSQSSQQRSGFWKNPEGDAN